MSSSVLLLPGLAEEGKVHMSLANVYKQLGEEGNTNSHISTAIIKLQAFCDEMDEIDNQVKNKKRP